MIQVRADFANIIKLELKKLMICGQDVEEGPEMLVKLITS